MFLSFGARKLLIVSSRSPLGCDAV